MNISTDLNTYEQSGQNQTTTTQRMESNKYKIRILSDRETHLTRKNERLWWEQVFEYIDFTYHKNLDELMDQGIETLDANTVYNINGVVIWTLGPKAKHEIMRGQWGRELEDVN